MADNTYLAEGVVFPADFKQTGLNLNEIIVGPTGGGKTWSIAYPRLIHTEEGSLVVPVSKSNIKKMYQKRIGDGDREVFDLNFAHPEESEIGYDPFDSVHSSDDIINLAKRFVDDTELKSAYGNDTFWKEAATSVLAAEIALIYLNAKWEGKRPCFGDVLLLHRSVVLIPERDIAKTSIDFLFEAAEKRFPGNQALQMWKTMSGNAMVTASCIFAEVNTMLDKIFSDEVIALTRKEKRISFKELGERKVTMFVTTSPMNSSLQKLTNIMYADMFRELFETAEKRTEGCLAVPVHIICDDFACGSKIPDFAKYISIFRAAGISVTMLLQSESQLKVMYGENDATTIIDNCDTYVYMGGRDIKTCQGVAQRANRSLEDIMNLPLERVIVFRRGSKPIEARRYQVYEDECFKKMMDCV